ncbi:urease accessory protein UreF [Planotetraspora thailandica]|uniref:Urease accessory protein UreF n=1 Tax=Planotetraspora thailandica TaxID=487172 RepID=A0A8J3V4S7_9ACTN|nr:urease accessory UreF family protein [Planotetraspora thailandica]GII54991.1 urease accessory protein UreF [Planotetraspora thailandica]
MQNDRRKGGMRGSPDAALLLLADSRLPAGGHAHSGGAEEAVRLGTITGPEDLARFLRGRLATAGLVSAALAAAACELASAGHDEQAAAHDEQTGGRDGQSDDPAGRWRQLDAEADARTASPAQREASRVQGRLLIRSARRIWPSPVLDLLAKAVPNGVHHPIALGAAAASAGCDPYQSALAAAYNAVTGPATAAVRLLGLDPVTVHRLLADLAPALNDAAHAACASLIDDVVMEPGAADPFGPYGTANGDAKGSTRGPGWPALPGHAAPALDLLAEGHHSNTMKLFVS